MDSSVLAILILTGIIIAYSTQLLPIGITSILGALAMMLAGIISPSELITGFTSDTVMMVAGMVVVGNALCETGLADITGRLIMKIPCIKGNEKLFLAVILLSVTLLSALMSNTATVAMFLPLIASVAGASEGKITRKNTYMAAGIASVLGGNLTLVGSTPQMVAQGILAQTEGCRTMGFFDITRGAVPAIVLMFIFYLTFGYDMQKKVFDFDDTTVMTAAISAPGAVGDRRRMICSGIIMLFCIAGFITGVSALGIIAMFGALACIVTGCISVKRAFATMDWCSIAVLGGALGFSKGLDNSGAIKLIAGHLMVLINHLDAKPYVILAVLMFIASIISAVMSNTATTAVFLPVALGIAKAVSADPMVFGIGIVISSNLDFASPIGTPPITMTLQGGYRFSDYFKVGGLFTVLSLIITIVLLPLLYSF